MFFRVFLDERLVQRAADQGQGLFFEVAWIGDAGFGRFDFDPLSGLDRRQSPAQQQIDGKTEGQR